MDKCREAFEAANKGSWLKRDADGDYENQWIDDAWETWQAAWQASREQADRRIAELEALLRWTEQYVPGNLWGDPTIAEMKRRIVRALEKK